MSETVATVTRADGSLKKEILKVRDEDGITTSVTESGDQ